MSCHYRVVLYPLQPPHFMPNGWYFTLPLNPQSLHNIAKNKSSWMGCVAIIASISSLYFSILIIDFRQIGHDVLFCCRQFIMHSAWIGWPHGISTDCFTESNKYSKHMGQLTWNRLGLHECFVDTHVWHTLQCTKFPDPFAIRQMPHCSQW